jgi:malate dehydrogenase (quinone)
MQEPITAKGMCLRREIGVRINATAAQATKAPAAKPTATGQPSYHGMDYSEDKRQISDWASLIIEGRDLNQPIAATRIVTGADVDYGALTHLLVANLAAQSGFAVHYKRHVVALTREPRGRWPVDVEDVERRSKQAISAKFVFIGAGGGALSLLQRSGALRPRPCSGLKTFSSAA